MTYRKWPIRSLQMAKTIDFHTWACKVFLSIQYTTCCERVKLYCICSLVLCLYCRHCICQVTIKKWGSYWNKTIACLGLSQISDRLQNKPVHVQYQIVYFEYFARRRSHEQQQLVVPILVFTCTWIQPMWEQRMNSGYLGLLASTTCDRPNRWWKDCLPTIFFEPAQGQNMG